MLEFIIAITVAVILWALRKAFYAQSNIFNTRVEIKVKEQEIDLQEDLESLTKLISERKKVQSGKWHSLKEIEDQMKSDINSDIN